MLSNKLFKKKMPVDNLRISSSWEHTKMTTWGTMILAALHVRTPCPNSHPQLVFAPLELLSSNWPIFFHRFYVGSFGLLCMSCVRPAGQQVEQHPSHVGGPDPSRRQIGIFSFPTPASEAACIQDCS